MRSLTYIQTYAYIYAYIYEYNYLNIKKKNIYIYISYFNSIFSLLYYQSCHYSCLTCVVGSGAN